MQLTRKSTAGAAQSSRLSKIVQTVPAGIMDRRTFLKRSGLTVGLGAAVSQLPFCAGEFGGVYLAASMLLGLAFVGGAVMLYRRADRRTALRLYLFSLAYLALLFLAMVADAHL